MGVDEGQDSRVVHFKRGVWLSILVENLTQLRIMSEAQMVNAIRQLGRLPIEIIELIARTTTAIEIRARRAAARVIQRFSRGYGPRQRRKYIRDNFIQDNLWWLSDRNLPLYRARRSELMRSEDFNEFTNRTEEYYLTHPADRATRYRDLF